MPTVQSQTARLSVGLIDFTQRAITPATPVKELIEAIACVRLFKCPHFRRWRIQATEPFTVGTAGLPYVLMYVGGGYVEFGGANYGMTKGMVMLLPGAVGACCFRPESEVTLLEITVTFLAMKSVIALDLDGTLAESKSPLDVPPAMVHAA
jgi:hypothetical protein